MTDIKLTTKTEKCAYIFTGQGTARWFIDKRGNPRPLFNILSMVANKHPENRQLKSLPWNELIPGRDYTFVLYESTLDEPVRGEGLCRITEDEYGFKDFHFYLEVLGKTEHFRIPNVDEEQYNICGDSWKYIIRYES